MKKIIKKIKKWWKTNKAPAIVCVIFMPIGFLVLFLIINSSKLQLENQRLKHNQQALTQDIKVWKSEDSSSVAEIGTLKLTKDEFLYYAYQLLILLDKHEDMLHKHAMEREQLELDKKRMKYLKERLALDTLKTKALYQTEDDDKKQDIIKSLDEKIEDFFGNPQKDEKE